MTLLHLLLAFAASALLVIGLTTLLNVFTFPRLGRSPQALPGSRPRLSFLIPARDEGPVIGRTVGALLAQRYPDFEVLILDDGSTDDTAAQALAAAAGDARLRIMTGQPLPTGWLGKNWACQQLGAAATGDILVFTDSEVDWGPDAATTLTDELALSGADLLTVWPTQITVTWAERFVVPLMALAILGYLPVLAVHLLPWPIFAAANGQCLAFRRIAYETIGGHATVAGEVVEDVALARRVKQSGRPLRMVDGHGRICCRMYAGWPSVRDGFAKNILSGHANSVAFLFLSTLFHWLVFVLPWVLWIVDWRFALLAGGGVIIRAATASFTLQRAADSIFMPVSVIMMTVIAARAIVWHYGGGPRWKGRLIRV